MSITIDFINKKSNEIGCQTALFNRIIEFKVLKMNDKDRGWDRVYTLKFELYSNIIVNTSYNFAMKSRMTTTKNIYNTNEHPLKYFKIDSDDVFFQLSEIKIESKCDKDFCIC